MDIWSEAAGAGGGADADRVVSESSAGVTGDAAGCDAWDAGELRGDVEKQGLALEAAGDEFDHVAEFSAGERFAQRVRRRHLFPQFLANDFRSFDHCAELRECYVARQMEAAAVGEYEHALGWDYFERFADALGYDVGSFDGLSFDVDHANAQLKWGWELLEDIEIFAAPTRKFEGELVDFCVEDFWKQIAVTSFPGGLTVTIAVTDVDRDCGADSVDHGVEGVYAPGNIVGKA